MNFSLSLCVAVAAAMLLLHVASAKETSFEELEREAHEIKLSPFAKHVIPLLDMIEIFSPAMARHAKTFETLEGWDRAVYDFFELYLFPLGVMIALYLPLVFLGRWYMRDRAPFDLKVPLILWNAALSIFSIWGTVYMVPIFFRVFNDISWYNSVCTRWCFGYGADNYLILLFTLSKIAEFVDTAFIILRKKPLMFLHYYHHVTTVSFCIFMMIVSHYSGCHAYMFGAMNFLVHSFMYTYYCISACGIRLPGFVATFITIIQIVQMIVGIIIIATHSQCPRPHTATVYTGFIIYGSFFVERYILKTRSPSPSQKGGNGKKRD